MNPGWRREICDRAQRTIAEEVVNRFVQSYAGPNRGDHVRKNRDGRMRSTPLTSEGDVANRYSRSGTSP